MRFALETRLGMPAANDFADQLTNRLEAVGGTVLREDEKPDMVLAVGGDGTMLAAVRRSLGWDVPVLGFNLGTLGFLANAEPSDLDSVAERLLNGDFTIEDRLTVSATVGAVNAVGVNDVVVEKIDSTRLVSLDVSIDGLPFVTYQADGLVVATPTGSTAYSFSARGPLVDPRVEALVMTPVASHSLFDRPLVLPADAEIEITVARDRGVRVNVDKGDLGELGEGETVKIEQGPRPARFVVLNSRDFPGLVKEKFGLD